MGKTPEFAWHRFYNADWDLLQTPADPHRLYTVGKLDGRKEADPRWCEGAGPVCLVKNRSAQRRLYERIFAAEREGMARILKNHNALAPASPPPLWITLGNEPNAYPYVDPEVYADMYARYRAWLRDPPPAGLGCGHCRLLTGGILLYDLVPASVLPMRSLLAPLLGPSRPGPGDTGVTYVGWKDWTRRFLGRLAALGTPVDRFDVHVYAGSLDFAPFPFLRLSLFRWSADPGALRGFLALARAAGHPDPKVWIGEFGSLQPWHGKEAMAALMRDQVAAFRAEPAVERWFWYKHAGRDGKTFLAPLTGLYRDARDTSTRTLLGRTYLGLRAEAGRRAADQAGVLRNPAQPTIHAEVTKQAPTARAQR